ncbi:MAG: aldehyde ferredoxin oxidoreductase N-terminal domain-containing protein, partial [Desulfobacteraceae bacterium]
GKWDLKDAFDHNNAIILMTGPLAGTGIASAGRTSVSGLAPQSWPVNWFSHSNFGGVFAPFLKFAGWDGIVIEGKSDAPAYLNIIDDKVTLEDAKHLWGLDTWKTQEEIWKEQGARNSIKYGSQWQKAGNGYTLQRPAIVTIGPAGENKSRIASLIHNGGSGGGQGGFGGVFGSKNLKAVAVVGTGSIKVAHPKDILQVRQWFASKWPAGLRQGLGTISSCCLGCNRGCHSRDPVYGQDSDGCAESMWFNPPSPYKKASKRDMLKATDLIQQLGINGSELSYIGSRSFPSPPGHPIQPSIPSKTGTAWYLKTVYDMGTIGPGKEVDTSPLPMNMWDSVEFAEIFALCIAKRIGIGDLLADGTVRFAEKIGRIHDINSILRYPAWGYVDHWCMPNVEWAYGTLMDSRDINNHDISIGPVKGMSCKEYVELLASACLPYGDDPFMFDYNWKGNQAYKTGIYSEHKARFIAWRQHYAMFYKESMLFCDWVFANAYSRSTEDGKGATPEAEPKLINAVTGNGISFTDGVEIGRKTWNVIRAIFAMQGKNRDVEKFSGYMYKPGASNAHYSTTIPVFDGSKWDWTECGDLYMNHDGVEHWKTAFYNIEGWDPLTGNPGGRTLKDLGLSGIADILKENKKLGV